jgi:hypothetical protein
MSQIRDFIPKKKLITQLLTMRFLLLIVDQLQSQFKKLLLSIEKSPLHIPVNTLTMKNLLSIGMHPPSSMGILNIVILLLIKLRVLVTENSHPDSTLKIPILSHTPNPLIERQPLRLLQEFSTNQILGNTGDPLIEILFLSLTLTTEILHLNQLSIEILHLNQLSIEIPPLSPLSIEKSHLNPLSIEKSHLNPLNIEIPLLSPTLNIEIPLLSPTLNTETSLLHLTRTQEDLRQKTTILVLKLPTTSLKISFNLNILLHQLLQLLEVTTNPDSQKRLSYKDHRLNQVDQSLQVLR